MYNVKKRIDRVVRVLTQKNSKYLRARKKPIMARNCLFEPGQGKNANGNMFALIRELTWNDAFKGFKAYFVTVEENDEFVISRLRRYGIDAQTVIRNSDEYLNLLARCEFLFTDNSFPPFFYKRTDQYYVNTWHGTPLKKLGKSNIAKSLLSFANVQKNILSADCVVFPNELTKYCFFEDYMLSKLYANRIAMIDYPRNDALVDEAICSVVQESENLSGKYVVAYMPTWRGLSHYVDIEKQIDEITQVFIKLDKLFSSDVLFFVNLHFLFSDSIDYTMFQHIKCFPSIYETYDFLSACDALVTDYSSVFFDFAVTGKKIILFPYDKDEYLCEVGTYIDYDSLPFPTVDTPETLAREINSKTVNSYAEFQEQYCSYHTGHSARDLLETICLRKPVLPLHENELLEPVNIHYAENFSNPVVSETVAKDINRQWSSNAVLTFMGSYRRKTIDFLEELPDEVNFLAITTFRSLTFNERLLLYIARRSVLVTRVAKKHIRQFYAGEANRLLPGILVDGVTLHVSRGEYFANVLGSLSCSKVYLERKPIMVGIGRRKELASSKIIGEFDVVESEIYPIESYSPDAQRVFYNLATNARLLTRISRNTDEEISLEGFLLAHMPKGLSTDNVRFVLPDEQAIGSASNVVKWGDTRILRYRISFTKADVKNLNTHNRVYFSYSSPSGAGFRVNTKYNTIDAGHSELRHGNYLIDENSGTTLYFRQGAGNALQLVARDINPLDNPENRQRLNSAYWLSRIFPKRNAIVLFEKKSSRYEESAAVVFEKLIDLGYKNVFFILDESFQFNHSLPEKYRERIVKRNSFLHYYLFFCAKTFIGSEMLSHCLELYTDSKKVRSQLKNERINYVFLQHGVMYMISLDSESRRFFKPRQTTTGKYRVITSSKKEAMHFVDRAKYEEEMLYICGLPKFDKNTWDTNANKIAIMLTWRPWEINAARIDFRNTGYYKLTEEIVRAIPSHLAESIVILPHPLFKKYAEDSNYDLKKYVEEDRSYDEVLKHTKLLITDYSSIAYDAFYRGANVLFYWKDKEECMLEYGPSTELMIDEDTAFGDVCYTQEELSASVETSYLSSQESTYVARFNRIVQFHDGKNTERLIGFMEAEGII